jgi:hypothetical protein
MLGQKSRTPGVYMICLEIFESGAVIGMVHIRQKKGMTRLEQLGAQEK